MLPNFKGQLSELDDNALCALVCSGNQLAFEEITRRYQGLIRLISKEYSYPGFDSGDFMQLGLMGLYGACKTYRSESELSFKNFAAVCIRRRYISLVRSLLSQKSIPSDSLVSIDEIKPGEYDAGPEALLLDKENDRLFFELIKSKLSYMEMCALKGYVEGLTYQEIADGTGLSTKAVDNALQRVRKKLLK